MGGHDREMNIKQIKAVMKKYGDAWEKKDTDLILECFTKTGKYQESPLAKPYVGDKAIAKFWDSIVVKNTRKIKFKTGKRYLSKDEKTELDEIKSNFLNLMDERTFFNKKDLEFVKQIKSKNKTQLSEKE